MLGAAVAADAAEIENATNKAQMECVAFMMISRG
jgi:hypothetical protein